MAYIKITTTNPNSVNLTKQCHDSKVSLSLFLVKDKAVKSMVFRLRILNLGFQGK